MALPRVLLPQQQLEQLEKEVDDVDVELRCVPRDVALARVEVLHADLRVEDHVTDEKREPPVDLHQLQLANGVSGILLNFNYISY